MILIARPNGETTLNGLEYLMNEDNSDYRFFNDKQEAVNFLRENIEGEVTDEQLEDSFMFLDTETDFEQPVYPLKKDGE